MGVWTFQSPNFFCQKIFFLFFFLENFHNKMGGKELRFNHLLP